MEVNAPFFDDPLASPGEAGQAFYGLWEYEVFESLFLNSKTKQYLEVELCLHRQHLVLLLSSGDAFAMSLLHGTLEWYKRIRIPQFNAA